MNSPASSQQLVFLWGKLASGGKAYHPQLCHMIDVGIVTREIWRNVYPPIAQKRLADGLQLSLDEAEGWITFLAALHDLGKASPAFQLRKQAKHLGPFYSDMGSLRPGIKPSDAPHGRVTASELPEILQDEFQMDSSVARRLSSVVGGHHGTFPTSLELQKMPLDGVGTKRWKESRHQLTIALANLFNVSRSSVPSSCDHWVSMEIAGLVSVADWIGSNSEFFPYYINDFSDLPAFVVEDYAREAEISAQRALTSPGWLGWSQPTNKKTFAELFTDIQAPRPLQELSIEVAEKLKAPSIVIIEAPMGEGKTEAALYLADQFGVTPGPRGLYVALPTQATSNQMFSRVRAFLKHRFPENNVNMQLLHGHAALSAEFETMKKAFAIHGIRPISSPPTRIEILPEYPTERGISE